MTSCCFDEDFYKKSKDEFDRMIQEMKGAVAASRHGSGEAIRQNMVFLDELVKNLFEVTRPLYAAADSKEQSTKEMVENWLRMVKRASHTARKRIFLVMQAHLQGWGFAKTLNFYQEGGKADKNWLKAMKKHNKFNESRGPYQGRGRGFGRGRGCGGYNNSSYSSGNSSCFQQQQAVSYQQPVQFAYPPPLGAPSGVNRRSLQIADEMQQLR